MGVPSKVAKLGSASDATRTLESRIPDACRKRKIECAPSADAQLREVLLLEVCGDRTAQAVEGDYFRRPRNRLPLVRRTAERKGTERDCRDPQTFSRVAADNSTHEPRGTAHFVVNAPSDVVNGLRGILNGPILCNENRVSGRRHSRETYRERCAKCGLRGNCRPTFCRIGPNLIEERVFMPGVATRKHTTSRRINE